MRAAAWARLHLRNLPSPVNCRLRESPFLAPRLDPEESTRRRPPCLARALPEGRRRLRLRLRLQIRVQDRTRLSLRRPSARSRPTHNANSQILSHASASRTSTGW